MPYGVDKKQGGDSKENTSWMERCVDSVMSKSKKEKGDAIAICKAQLKRKKESSFDDPILIDEDILNTYNVYKEASIRKIMNTDNVTFNQAYQQFQANLARNNYIF